MPCFSVDHLSLANERFALIAGVKSSNTKIHDGNGKTWALSNFIVVERDPGCQAKSREDLNDEYLECFRESINAYNMHTIPKMAKPTWMDFVELLFLHSARRTIQDHYPELLSLFDSPERSSHLKFDPTLDIVRATTIFRPGSLGYDEHAFITAAHPWKVLVSTTDTNLDVPLFPLEEQPIPQNPGFDGGFFFPANNFVYPSPTSKFVYSSPHHDENVPARNLRTSISTLQDTPSTSSRASATTPSSPSSVATEPRIFAPSRAVSGQARQVSEAQASLAADVGIDLGHYGGDITPRIIRNRLTPQELNCSVRISRIDPEVTNQEIFATIHTGAIYSFNRVSAIPGRYKTDAVDLAFMARSAAEDFVAEANRLEGIQVRGKSLPVMWNKNHVGPCKLPVSRVLRVSGPSAGLDLETFLKYCNAYCYSDVIAASERITGDSCEVVVEFGSYRSQAEFVYSAVKMDPLLKEYSVEYLVDPCSYFASQPARSR